MKQFTNMMLAVGCLLLVTLLLLESDAASAQGAADYAADDSQSQVLRLYRIVGLGGKCLDIKGGGTADKTPIILFKCHGNGNNQHWVVGVDNEIRSVGGKCLDVQGGSSKNGTPIILFRCHGGRNQKWSLKSVGNDKFQIKGLGGKCLDVKKGSSANRTPIILYTCHGGENQKWKLVP